MNRTQLRILREAASRLIHAHPLVSLAMSDLQCVWGDVAEGVDTAADEAVLHFLRRADALSNGLNDLRNTLQNYVDACEYSMPPPPSPPVSKAQSEAEHKLHALTHRVKDYVDTYGNVTPLRPDDNSH